ncbi:hypothetical protein ALP73_01107 [Pseudomonas coronafaciens pv. garcae]|uniref:hypothetical protein n=1 Tax=Pseudomonas syringae group TaxID=136849 RepID=UPI000F010172|nr:hypothetical protein [Pseudomonas coronafaciens]RMS09328.1 hypothetical protein ALP73_01107 [Pseudomonas coronafaciens pv. garcae]
MKRLPSVRLPPKRRQTGFLVAQAAFVVVILSLAFAYYGNRYWQASLNQERDDKAKLIGERMASVSDATKTYATTFFTQIQRGESVTRNGYSVAPQRLLGPTLNDLSGLGFLPATAINPVVYNGQSIQYNVAMRVNTQSGCTIPTCSLLFQVTTSAPLLIPNGNTVDIRRATIAATAASPGNAGVSMPSSMGGDPSVFVGNGGTVTGINTGGVAGLVSMSNGYDSQGFFEFLRRDGSLPMTGSLNMQDSSGVKHDIMNAGDVSTVNLTASKGVTGDTITSTSRLKTNEFLQINGVAVEGQACETRTVGLDASGLALTCTAGRWRSPVTISSPYTAYIPIKSPAQNLIVPMGIHKICLLSGAQTTGEGADHCIVTGFPGTNWELSARTTRDTITDHWCVATCID